MRRLAFMRSLSASLTWLLQRYWSTASKTRMPLNPMTIAYGK